MILAPLEQYDSPLAFGTYNFATTEPDLVFGLVTSVSHSHCSNSMFLWRWYSLFSVGARSVSATYSIYVYHATSRKS